MRAPCVCVSNLPSAILQAGWRSPEAAWRDLPAEELATVTQMLAIRDDVNQVRPVHLLETLRAGKHVSSPARCRGELANLAPCQAHILLCRWMATRTFTSAIRQASGAVRMAVGVNHEGLAARHRTVQCSTFCWTTS